MTGTSSESIENLSDLTKVYLKMLELAIDMRRAGDVYIQQPKNYYVGKFDEISPCGTLLSEKTLIKGGGQAHNISSYVSHNCSWCRSCK